MIILVLWLIKVFIFFNKVLLLVNIIFLFIIFAVSLGGVCFKVCLIVFIIIDKGLFRFFWIFAVLIVIILGKFDNKCRFLIFIVVLLLFLEG